MDWNGLIEQLGGGLGAAIIVGLAACVAWLARKLIEQMGARVEDAQRHGEAMRQITETTTSAMRDMEQAVREQGRDMDRIVRGFNG